MKKPLKNNDETRKKIIGLGENSARKSYFPQLKKQFEELQQKNRELEQSNEMIKKVNQEMTIALEQKAAILKCLPDLMFSFAADGTIIDFYANFTENLYALPQEFLNKHVSEVLPPGVAKMTVNKIKRVLENREIESYRYQLEREGRVSTFESRMIFVNNNTTLAIVRDITETEQLIEDLKTAKEKAEQSDKLKSAFLANLSHEIRTPMNGIIGFSKLYTDKDYSDMERDRFAATVISSSKQLLSIVNDILDISRIESGLVTFTPEYITLRSIISDIKNIYSPVAEEKKLTFHVDCKACDLALYTDGTKIRQILNNLLSNAFKFTKKGGITLEVSEHNNDIIFKVKDTGIGIPEDKREIIFERFMQVEVEVSKQYGGTGLGLSISRKLAKILKGTLILLPSEGNGSVFQLKIPKETTKE